MVTIQILKRNDAASLIVSIAMSLIVVGVITSFSTSLAQTLTASNNFGDRDFVSGYVYPLILFVLQLVFLEIGLRGVIFLRAAYLKSQ